MGMATAVHACVVSEQAPLLLTSIPGRADLVVFAAAVVESSFVLQTDGAALFCRFPLPLGQMQHLDLLRSFQESSTSSPGSSC